MTGGAHLLGRENRSGELRARLAPARETGVERARAGDDHCDVFADTHEYMEVYREWVALARPAPGPGNLRRPLHFARAVKPTRDAYNLSNGNKTR